MKKLFTVLCFGTMVFAATAAPIFSTNSVWRFLKGTVEASTPDPAAWRAVDFADAGWSFGTAPFYYDMDTSVSGYTGNTELLDMPGSYTCVFLRKTFVVTNFAALAELQLAARSDDGFIAWINGTEVVRFNLPDGELAYNGVASGALTEPIPVTNFVLAGPHDYLLPGTNVITVQAFNSSLGDSSDFLIWLTLDYTLDTTPPTAGSIPAPGATVRYLRDVEIDFDEAVTNVAAAALLINGSPATNLTAFTASQYIFEFPQPPTGTVQLAWAPGQGIQDLAGNSFAGGGWTYRLDPNAPVPDIQISEFMAENVNSIRDEDGDYSDWIELLNPTDDDLNLSGWALTDDALDLQKWRLPNVTLSAHSYLLVFASGKDRTNATGQLHANFQLDAAGEFLALVDAGQNIISAFSPVYPPQLAGFSYGRDRVSPNLTGYFNTPTPGVPNATVGAGFAPDVQFARAGGTYLNPFSLQLSTTSSNAAIRYTLDGTPPAETSLLYSNAIAVNASLQVRARAFVPTLFPGAIRSESYLRLNASLAPTNSNLPAIVIYNFNGGAVPVDVRQFANYAFFEPENGLTWLTNAPTLSVRGSIHVRGSSTQNLPKQSFSVEFWNEFNDDEDHSPLGLPAQSDWVLYAPNNFEPVLLHNPLAYQLSNEIGRYASRTRFVEVYLNTDGTSVSPANYNGIYVLEEKIKRDQNRVDVAKLDPEDIAVPDITGGYIMKVDRLDPGDNGFYAAGQGIAYVYPKEADINTPQRAPQKSYLQDSLDAFGAALNGASYTNYATGFRAFVDTDSWVDHHILNVASFNVDALRLSAYFYKPRDGKLYFGPAWDFDRSQGSTDGRDFNPRVWRAATDDLGTDFFNYTWWGRMFTDIDFWQQWIDRYQILRTDVLSTNHIYAAIDALADQVRRQQPREAARWPSLTKPRNGVVAFAGYSNTFPGTYQGEVDFLKKWYAARLDFMDTNFLARPLFSQDGGAISAGFALSMTAPAGATIYYTTNGSDPRRIGGGLAPEAQVYVAPVLLPTNATILARARNLNHHNLTGANKPPQDSPWSGLHSATFLFVSPPVVTLAPVSLAAYPGQSPTFSVSATGSPAPVYQWQCDGTNIAGATNSQLTFTGVQTNRAGLYSVIVSNVAGTTNLSATLTLTPKPNLVITEVMSSEAGGVAGHQDWWELSNLDTFAVNLRGYRFDDDSASLSAAYRITNDVTIVPGESIVFVENMTSEAFREWWGPQNFRSGFQVLTYVGSGLGLSAASDAINVWNAAANTNTDKIAGAVFFTATRGVSFGYDPAGQAFGALSVPNVNGAFVASVNGDLGSPGVIVNQPRFPTVSQGGSGLDLTFVTQPGRTHRVEYKNELTDPTWATLTNVLAVTNMVTITDPASLTNVSRYYRVVLLP